MKPNFLKTDIGEDSIIQKLNYILTNLNSANFLARSISGETDATADTQRLFKHGMTVAPTVNLLTIGDVYIAAIDNNFIDIRSRLSSAPFTIYLA